MKYLFCIVLILSVFLANAQDPNRFNKQVEQLLIKDYGFNSDKKLVVFTGSSSIVRWKTVQTDFLEYNIINNGFGGSHFSDLIYFYDKLILTSKPDIVFIYEGDNDVANGKEVNLILRQAKELHKKIQRDLPETKVIFISPKPCLKNWDKKDTYIVLNKKLKKYCQKQKNLEFADVWSKMVDETGIVFQDIFVEDGDHMNAKGYAIWVDVMGAYLN